MEPERRRYLVLAALLVVLAGVVYYQVMRTSGEAPSSSNGTGGPTRTASRAKPAGPSTPEVPDVHLGALDGERPKPGEEERNLFQFKVKRAPAPPPVAAKPPPEVPVIPAGPPPPPPLPPIALKFIGLVEAPEQSKRVAILSDGRGGPPIFGSEGQTILGQYRIIRIGAESIEMSYLDGRGRQTIRLSGS